MKVAILGTNGVLGSHLLATTPAGVVATGFGGRANVSNLTKVLEDESYDVLINAAGRIPETFPTAREAIDANALLPLALAPVCARNDVMMFHVSTDCVYGGAVSPAFGPRMWRAEEDPPMPDPESVYSLSKLLGEKCDAVIVRTSFAHPSRGFWRQLRLAHENSPRVPGDFPGYLGHWWSGSTTPEAADAIWRLVRHHEFSSGGRYPVYHVATESPIRKLQACEAVVRAEVLRVHVRPSHAGGVADRSLTPTTRECVMAPFEEALARV